MNFLIKPQTRDSIVMRDSSIIKDVLFIEVLLKTTRSSLQQKRSYRMWWDNRETTDTRNPPRVLNERTNIAYDKFFFDG